MLRNTMVSLTLPAALVLVMGGLCTSRVEAQFAWIDGLIKNIEGFNLFVGPAWLRSGQLNGASLVEVGFELDIGLFGSDGNEPTTGPAATCQLSQPSMECTIRTVTQTTLGSAVSLTLPDSVEVSRTTTRRVVPNFRDAAGEPARAPRATWLTRADSIASVDSTGVVTGVGEGTTVVVIAAGALKDSVVVRVTKRPITWSGGLQIGFDAISGFQAKDPTLRLAMGVRDLPSVTLYASPNWPSEAFSFYGGATVGLAQLWNASAELTPRDTTAAGSRSYVPQGETLQWGGALGAQLEFLFVEAAVRVRNFRGIKWTDGTNPVLAPESWPRILDLTTLTLRFGFQK